MISQFSSRVQRRRTRYGYSRSGLWPRDHTQPLKSDCCHTNNVTFGNTHGYQSPQILDGTTTSTRMRSSSCGVAEEQKHNLIRSLQTQERRSISVWTCTVLRSDKVSAFDCPLSIRTTIITIDTKISAGRIIKEIFHM